MEITEHTPPFYSPVKEIIFPKMTYPEIGHKVNDDVRAVEVCCSAGNLIRLRYLQISSRIGMSV